MRLRCLLVCVMIKRGFGIDWAWMGMDEWLGWKGVYWLSRALLSDVNTSGVGQWRIWELQKAICSLHPTVHFLNKNNSRSSSFVHKSVVMMKVRFPIC